ncbi:M20 metallopeptidase family protein [Clostridium saccharobutylicum]|uniref:Thermostable carboxypeptidase 2 n=1 Tax=Clostridium saccharobutylicum DSM 13864 TaxID=1345695 RepID=U5MWQ9_CLOSA|nr:M20 family metallopeptidase [Clostridium saccharobutylicum]AGX44071.1 thermostable carboxypeptidase 2 [Clostridium saccharobutylicum DSM 13864]AQR91362.1 putative hydrolase YxeP [Clostridium saccharobutylicum]AQS01266.1 putative hydrolase YxeP [Clostridium saccharobutylicum]AQS10877.1 putative hydrolase YxeP [Clostridium saccharobutylicum]AQS15249.1 putative hydrolase YxeP [Clostridium saccharobutylicum]
MIDFRKEANNIKEELVEIRRDLHEHPETGFEEYRTSKVIKDFLSANDIPYIEVAKTGVCGIIKGTKEGKNKTIALRGDIDALPIQDMKTCEFKSKVDGKMHACGHDAHTTILMGAAKLLNEHKNEFSGTVKLLFEPAEETTGGAPDMITQGVLENPRVDCVLGLHVDEETECGTIKIKKGVVNAASNPFSIKITGQGGHGASPHTTVDPVVIASHIVIALQTVVSREIAPVNPAVITVGTLHAGTAQNIIPGEATLSGMIRTMTKEDRAFAIQRLNEIVNGIATMSRAKAEIKVDESYPCLYNNDENVDLITESASLVLGKENVLEQRAPKMGVESFAYFANERPSAFYFLGSGNKEKKTTEPAHSNLFNIDEDCLPIGVAIQADAAFNYLIK